MVFIIFLISALVLEGILRRDEAATQKTKRTQIAQAPSMEIPTSGTSSVLILAKAIEQHSQQAPSPIAQNIPQGGDEYVTLNVCTRTRVDGRT